MSKNTETKTCPECGAILDTFYIFNKKKVVSCRACDYREESIIKKAKPKKGKQ